MSQQKINVKYSYLFSHLKNAENLYFKAANEYEWLKIENENVFEKITRKDKK